MNYLQLTSEDWVTPIPIAAMADLCSALLGVVDHLPANMPLTMASLKRLVMPLGETHVIEHQPSEQLPWHFHHDGIYQDEHEWISFKAKTLAQLLPEVISYQIARGREVVGHFLAISWEIPAVQTCSNCGADFNVTPTRLHLP